MGAIRNSLLAERTSRGWTQERVARAAGIARQSYAAIESGTSVPSTEVALRLSRVFGRGVESLFQLDDAAEEVVTARWVGAGPVAGRRVRLYRVGGERYADPVVGDRPSQPADGRVVGGSGDAVRVGLLADRPPEPDLVVAGCDPAIGVVIEALRRARGIRVLWRHLGSRAALAALGRGEVHVAGAHLREPDGEDFNGRWVSEYVPFRCVRVSFAWWEQGLVVAPGNPRGIETVADLARPDLRFLNREEGSGSRALLEARLAEVGIPAAAIPGIGSGAPGHMSVAEAVAVGVADVGVAIRAAARAYGLDSVPLGIERYDLVIPNHFLDLPAVGALLGALGTPGVRAQVDALGGYDVTVMGREC